MVISNDDLAGMRQHFFDGGVAPVSAVGGAVLRSWQRVRAGQPLVPQPAASPVLFELRCAAEPEVRRLAQTVQDAGYAVVLTNQRVKVVLVVGDCTATATWQTDVRPGADWSEPQLGTNAFACATAEQRMVAVCGGEHTASAWADVQSLAAPVFDPCGNLIGALGLVRARGATPATEADPAALLPPVAQAIELRLIEQVRPDVVLQIGLRGAEPGPAARVCLNAQGAVLAINRDARQLLGWRTGRPDTFAQLFDAPFKPWLASLRAHPAGQPLRSVDGLLLWARAAARRAPPPHEAPHETVQTLGAMSDHAVRHALAQANGNVSAAARALGISRSTLHRWLRRV